MLSIMCKFHKNKTKRLEQDSETLLILTKKISRTNGTHIVGCLNEKLKIPIIDLFR